MPVSYEWYLLGLVRWDGKVAQIGALDTNEPEFKSSLSDSYDMWPQANHL
jgi:hypothetical protein